MLVSSQSSYRRKLPLNYKKGDYHQFAKEMERTIPAVSISTATHVKVNSSHVIFKNVRIEEISYYRAEYLRRLKFVGYLKLLFNNLVLKRSRKLNEGVSVTDLWSASYYHWLTEAIPRLFVVVKKLTNPVIILPEYYKSIPFAMDSLTFFNIKKIEFISTREILKVKRLYKVPPMAPQGSYNEEVLKSLRTYFTTFIKKKNKTRPDLGERIYISRSKANKRRIINEIELDVILEKYNFSKVVLEDYDWEDQVAVIMQARYLVSIHGAGLSNMIFMKEEGAVFELRGREEEKQIEDSLALCYFSLASALNLHYFYQMCEKEHETSSLHHANLIADVSQFDLYLSQMVKI